MNNLITDILLLLPEYLCNKDLLRLWQSNRRLNRIYTSILLKRKLRDYGYRLSFNADNSLLNNTYILKEKDNILTTGKYNLEENLDLKDVQNGFFIINGEVSFKTNKRIIKFEEGRLFNISEGSLYVDNMDIEISNEGTITVIDLEENSSILASITYMSITTFQTHKKYKDSFAACFYCNTHIWKEDKTICNGGEIRVIIKRNRRDGPQGEQGLTGTTGNTRTDNYYEKKTLYQDEKIRKEQRKYESRKERNRWHKR
jgi:hypothetical protein